MDNAITLEGCKAVPGGTTAGVVPASRQVYTLADGCHAALDHQRGQSLAMHGVRVASRAVIIRQFSVLNLSALLTVVQRV